MPKTFAERFWAKVNRTETCWLWTGSRFGNGYGCLHAPLKDGRRRKLLAHRVAYELTYGEIPEGINVCHSCDANYPPGDITYRHCVRPDHLLLGTHADNVHDCMAKGRMGDHMRGEANYLAVLTEVQVMQIRADYAAGGVSQADLGRRFGVTQSAILKVVKGIRWSHLPVIDYGTRTNKAYHPAIGEGHGRHKLTLSQALAIHSAMGTQAAIATQYGVCRATVSMIKTGRNWARAIREHGDTPLPQPSDSPTVQH